MDLIKLNIGSEMAIYNISDFSEKEKIVEQQELFPSFEKLEEKVSKKDRFFSSLAARLFFTLLLIADLLWGLYVIFLSLVYFSLNALTLFRFKPLRRKMQKCLLSFRRFIVCGLSLMIAVFSPSLGILFSCMYFMMYDKKGIEEVVPASLRDQFQEFFPGT